MSIVGDYDNGQFDDYYEICDREYDEEIYWDLKTLLDLAEELPMYITGLAEYYGAAEWWLPKSGQVAQRAPE